MRSEARLAGTGVAARDVAVSDPAVTEVTPTSWDRGRLRAATLVSAAAALPERVVDNVAIAAGAGVSERWIVERTGVRERRWVSDGEGVAELAAAAGRSALARAGTAGADVDLVVVATVAADDITPGAAPLVALELGARGAAAIDVNAACTGYLSALSLATAQIEAGRCERALVIGAEALSRFVDPGDRRTAALFADGAGATVLAPADGGGGRIGPVVLHSDGSGADAIRATQEERLIRMQGHDTFREAVRRMCEAALEVAERAAVSLDDVGLFVFHQANARILAAVSARLGLDRDRVIDCIDRYGNTSAATLPIALAEAQERGMLEPGATVLLSAFGAGFTWGAGVIEWA